MSSTQWLGKNRITAVSSLITGGDNGSCSGVWTTGLRGPTGELLCMTPSLPEGPFLDMSDSTLGIALVPAILQSSNPASCEVFCSVILLPASEGSAEVMLSFGAEVHPSQLCAHGNLGAQVAEVTVSFSSCGVSLTAPPAQKRTWFLTPPSPAKLLVHRHT